MSWRRRPGPRRLVEESRQFWPAPGGGIRLNGNVDQRGIHESHAIPKIRDPTPINSCPSNPPKTGYAQVRRTRRFAVHLEGSGGHQKYSSEIQFAVMFNCVMRKNSTPSAAMPKCTFRWARTPLEFPKSSTRCRASALARKDSPNRGRWPNLHAGTRCYRASLENRVPSN